MPFLDGGVLYHPGKQRLWVLNGSLAYIWCLLPEVATPEQLKQRLAADFGISDSTAEHDIAAALAHLGAEGLLEGTDAPEEQAPADAPSLLNTTDLALPEQISTKIVNCRLKISGFHITCGISAPHIAERFKIAFHYHLTQEQTDQHLNLITIGTSASGHDIYLDGRQSLDSTPESAVIPLLYGTISQWLRHQQQNNLIFHAAVAERNGTAIVLPAESGSGKSTLTAALIQQDWNYYSDEIAIIEPNNLLVKPHPLPLAIKPGSLTVLAQLGMDAGNEPEYQRLDGKRVRYLPIPPPATRQAEIGLLIFPKYTEGSQTSIEPLAKEKALQRLAKTGSTERSLTLDDVRGMIRLIENTPCFDLNFSNINQAIQLIQQLT